MAFVVGFKAAKTKVTLELLRLKKLDKICYAKEKEHVVARSTAFRS